MAVRSTNTMMEGLTKLIQQISALKVLPDADLDFLGTLEASVIDYSRQAAQSGAQSPMMGGLPGTGLPQGSVPSASTGSPPPNVMPMPQIPPEAMMALSGGTA